QGGAGGRAERDPEGARGDPLEPSPRGQAAEHQLPIHPVQDQGRRARRQAAPPRKSMNVKATARQSGTVAFALSYLGRDPHTVARITNTLAGCFASVCGASRRGETVKERGGMMEWNRRLDAGPS